MIATIAISLGLVLLTSLFSLTEHAEATGEGHDVQPDKGLKLFCVSKPAAGGEKSLKSGESKSVWCNEAKSYPNNCNPEADYCLKAGDFFLGGYTFKCEPPSNGNVKTDLKTMKAGDWWRIYCK